MTAPSTPRAGAVTKESCDHFYAWVSPAGTSGGAHLCMHCNLPDPAWLNKLNSGPRVAESIDDLRVGQVVAVDAHGFWKVGTIRDVGNEGAMVQLQGDGVRSQSGFGFAIGAWVLLSDPPPEPVTVSREAFDRLAEAVASGESIEMFRLSVIHSAARALVDEVRADR